jgi:hypothetical protein
VVRGFTPGHLRYGSFLNGSRAGLGRRKNAFGLRRQSWRNRFCELQ